MSKRVDRKEKLKNSYKYLHSTKNSIPVIQPPPVIPDLAMTNANRNQPRRSTRMPMPILMSSLRKATKDTQAQQVTGRSSKVTVGMGIQDNNNKSVERISSCLLNQVRKMRSDTDLTKCQQANDLERLKALKMEEMNETEQEVYHLYSQTASIDQTCTRISQELDTILGKHEYLKQLREHTKKKESLLKCAIRQNQNGEQQRTMRDQPFSFTIANASVSAQQSSHEMPLVDTLKRNLETKLDKLRFLQSVADGIKAEATIALETKMPLPRISDQGIGSPLTGTTSTVIPAAVPSKLTLQNLQRHDQLTLSSYTDITLPTTQVTESQQGPHPDFDELESVPEELEDVRAPSSFGSEMDTVISDYEEEELYGDEEVLTDEEVFPSSREEDNWADSEGESDTSRHSRTPRPRAPDSNSTRSTDETPEVEQQQQVSAAAPPPVRPLNLDEYAPPKTDFLRTKPAGIQPLKAHIFPWMELGRNQAETQSKKVAGFRSSSPSRSQSETSIVSYKDGAQWPTNFDEDKQLLKRGSHRNLNVPEEPLIVKGRAIPPRPPTDPDKIDLKDKTSRLPVPISKKSKVKPKPVPIIPEIQATELMADVSTVLEPPKMTELLEKAKRPIGLKPKRPSLNVAKSSRPVSRPPSAHNARPASNKNGRPTSAKNFIKANKYQLTKKSSKLDTIYQNPSSVSSDDSEQELEKPAKPASPQKPVWVMTPGATSTKQVIYGTFEAGSDDDSSQVKPKILRSKKSLTEPPEMATATEGRVKFRKVSMRMDPVTQTQSKTNRFPLINTLPPNVKPAPATLADDKVLLAKIIPDAPTRKAVANGIENISRIIDSKTAIRKNRPLTPHQFRTEYRASFNQLAIKKSEYKVLNAFRKPPVPSHIVQTQGPKPPELPIQLVKKTSASGNHFLKISKRSSLSNLSGTPKSKSKTKMDTMKRAKAHYSRTALVDKSKSVQQTKKPLPDHLAFGNFTGLKSQRSARVSKPETKGFSLLPQAASARTNRDHTLRNIKDLKPKKSLFPTSKFSQSRFIYAETK